MIFNAYLQFGAAIFCIGLACFALLREYKSFVHQIFAIGMLALAIEAVITGLSITAIFPEEVISLQQWRWATAALLPGCWLIFSLTFTLRENRSLPTNWKWVVLGVFPLHLALVSIFRGDFFRGVPTYLSKGWRLDLGWSGYLFCMCFLISLVLIIMILERTIRESRGLKRWQIKFIAAGIGSLFAGRIYTTSLAVIHQSLMLELEALNATALVVADLLILISLLRAGVLKVDLQPSLTALYNSFAVLVVGVYFLVVAFSWTFLNHYLPFPFGLLFIFFALLGLLLVLLSDRVRVQMKRFISLHFRKPHYDYRKTWMTFTERTSTLLDEKSLSDSVVKMISEMFDFLSVSVWFLEEREGALRCSGSTVFSETQTENQAALQDGISNLMSLLRDHKIFLDLEDKSIAGTTQLQSSQPNFFREARIRYCIPLVAGGDLIGMITLGDRILGKPLSFEEQDMLKTISDQVAASLLNRKLSNQLRQAKEMEAFQTMAAFFVHDLKNLASKLSTLLQNLQVHFGNPEFQEDVLSLIFRCVTKINNMCTGISKLRERLEIQFTETDLNELVRTTLKELKVSFNISVVENLRPVPKIYLDSDKIGTVLSNLIMNANEALGNSGQISITTKSRDGWIELAVSDDGCGMSQETLEECLFRAFKTTKKQGMGIGLFHSKIIVEAHKGRMEVESQEGFGSTFRVLLPIDEA